MLQDDAHNLFKCITNAKYEQKFDYKTTRWILFQHFVLCVTYLTFKVLTVQMNLWWVLSTDTRRSYRQVTALLQLMK